MTYEALLNRFPASYDVEALNQTLRAEIEKNKGKIVVLDDDPTGTQTVHGVDVYTDWSYDSFHNGFAAASPLFFVLTNSRSFSREKTAAVHKEIANHLLAQKQPFILISRGDSTLRGHYPTETAVMNEVFSQKGLIIDGEIILPFFPEGGRYTAEDIHYVRYGEEMIPAGETEYARDKTFPYTHSDLKKWVEEKTEGTCPAHKVQSIAIEDVRRGDVEKIEQQLLKAADFEKIVVNALTYDDLKVFAIAYYRALTQGKHFLLRSAAAIVKILGGISDQPLLKAKDLADGQNPNGGLIVVGSHVKRTTAQVEALKKDDAIVFEELNQHLALDGEAFHKEMLRVSNRVNQNLEKGLTSVVMTRRERFDVQTGSQEDELSLAVAIGDKLTQIVANLVLRPKFIIAKGGITSSDVATKGLGIKKAEVVGQVLPGVPVWRTGPQSKFEGLNLVIFPGNVGDDEALAQVVNSFKE